MISVSVRSGDEYKRFADVTKYNAIKVAQETPDVPPVGTANRTRYNSVLLGSTGGHSGVTSMNVNGSVTPQEFYYRSAEEYDIIITQLIVVLVDGSISFNKFGAEPALANGFSIAVEESGQETSIIEAVSTTGELVAAAGLPNEYKVLSNYDAANDDAFIMQIDVRRAVAGGIRIGRGTQDKIYATVRDDLTGLVDFTVRALGARHYP